MLLVGILYHPFLGPLTICQPEGLFGIILWQPNSAAILIDVLYCWCVRILSRQLGPPPPPTHTHAHPHRLPLCNPRAKRGMRLFRSENALQLDTEGNTLCTATATLQLQYSYSYTVTLQLHYSYSYTVTVQLQLHFYIDNSSKETLLSFQPCPGQAGIFSSVF